MAEEETRTRTRHQRLKDVVESYLAPYFARNPTAAKALDAIKALGSSDDDDDEVHWDHLAFRTFDADGCGIDSIAEVFAELGYERRDELRFEKKKLVAYWFAPPKPLPGKEPGGVVVSIPRTTN